MSAQLSKGIALAETASQAGKLWAYIGTFSSPLRDVLPTQVDLPPGNGRGIHIFEVNRSTGVMTEAGTFDLGTSPSCLEVNSAGTRLYSANETDRVGEKKHGSVNSYSINPVDGSLTLLNSVPSGGAGPTFVSMHPSGKFLFVANYFGGSIAALPILEDGTLAAATDVQIDEGEIGPTRAVHAPPGSFAISGHDRTHAHMIQSDPSGNFVLHIDLGLDTIFVWKFDVNTGKFSPAQHHKFQLPPGDGPRHFSFHSNRKWMYSIQEEGSTVVLFDWNTETGELKARQTISTLPEGFAGSNFCSGIHVSHDGKFVYAGNRLHDCIAIFKVGEDGILTYLEEVWTRGSYPRSFTFDPTGKFLYCCNQRGDHVAAFQVNQETGSLTFSGQYLPVGNPSHILFVDQAR
ncbi:lactonase family protein [Planctomicrobium sp. SH668]|uniref:lactonase family protein n=1 Tax=Planctomicrobium sp. SH668 TaxID=3448126 RepID=UPI003F5C2ED1